MKTKPPYSRTMTLDMLHSIAKTPIDELRGWTHRAITTTASSALWHLTHLKRKKP